MIRPVDLEWWRLLGYAMILCWIPAKLIVSKLMPRCNLFEKILLVVFWPIWVAPLLVVVPYRLLRGGRLWFQR
ncbi:MAG TPA: hypothetical protein VMW80_14275 [Candidatus Dormibacteraeota bacterium]|nr:hypothetical protein [Candidatus Dormibacteraeota bacterium]